MHNENLRVLFLSDNFPPELNAPATRTYEHAKIWVETGTDVTVITCFPNFPSGRVFKGYKNKLYQIEYINGIRVIRVLSYITANKGFLRRTLDYASFAITSFIAGLFVKTDIIIATSPQFFTVISGYLLSVFKRKPWIFELRDLWPQSIEAVGMMRGRRLLNVLEKVELFLYRKATSIVAVTNAFKKDLVERGVPANKIHIVPNGANTEIFKPADKNEKLLEKLNLKEKFIVGYIGTHGMAHGLDFILRCASKIKDPQIHFLFIGDGAEKENLLKLSKELNLRNATFLPPVKKDLVPEYMSIIDVALVPLRKKKVFETVIPSKIFEAAAMGKPCLLGVKGEAEALIKTYGCGLSFEPESEPDFIEKLMFLKKNASKKEMTQGCLKLAKDYDRRKLAEKMLSIIKNTAKGKNK